MSKTHKDGGQKKGQEFTGKRPYSWILASGDKLHKRLVIHKERQQNKQALQQDIEEALDILYEDVVFCPYCDILLDSSNPATNDDYLWMYPHDCCYECWEEHIK